MVPNTDFQAAPPKWKILKHVLGISRQLGQRANELIIAKHCQEICCDDFPIRLPAMGTAV